MWKIESSALRRKKNGEPVGGSDYTADSSLIEFSSRFSITIENPSRTLSGGSEIGDRVETPHPQIRNLRSIYFAPYINVDYTNYVIEI